MKRSLVAIACILALSACSKHTDFPSMLPIVAPPAPSNFTVTTSNDIVYDLSWTINNPSAVAYYRLYAQDLFTGAPVLADTTMTTAVQVDLQVPVPGVVFGVSSVSNGNVESAIVYGSAP